MSAEDHKGSETVRADFWLGRWLVSPQLNQIRKNGERIDLQNLSMEVLVYLAERQGQVVSKTELFDNVWHGRVVGDDAIHRRISDLRSQLGDSRRNAEFIQTISKKGYRLVAQVKPVVVSEQPRWRMAALIAISTITIGALGTLLLTSSDVSVPAVTAPPEAAPVTRVTIETSPPGAMVYFKPYLESGGNWEAAGMSPLEIDLPKGTLRLRFVADGFRAVEMAAPNPSMVFNNVDRDYYVVEMPGVSDVPPEMVYVPGGETIVPLFGYYRQVDLGRYLIGRTEVSNRQYTEFIADGGYQKSQFWDGIEDPAFEFSMVSDRFVDTTGRPGPAFWIDGGFALGTGNMPVTGVSWYEAMAYANYRGMELPSARHWARAALGIDESRWPLAPALLSTANIDGASPMPVTDDAAISTWGAVNLIGNVREWTTTKDGESRLSLGLGFPGQQWRYAMPDSSQPLQRLPDQGIRLVSYIDKATDPPLRLGSKVPSVPDITESEYAAFARMFAYESDPSIAETTKIDDIRPDRDWIRQRLVIHSDKLPAPLPVLIFHPANIDGSVQPILYLPPGDSYTGNFPSADIDITKYGIEFVVESGRALVWPIIAGTHERFRPRSKESRQALVNRWTKGLQVRRAEIGAVIDYLESQPEFDADRTGLLASSFGATFVSPNILAMEHRIRTAVLLSSSLAAINPAVFPAEVNPNTYWPRVTTPILLMNGSYDISIHVTKSRDLLLQTIGTTGNNKRGILYDAPHWPLPPHRVRNDTLSWFDNHLGPP